MAGNNQGCQTAVGEETMTDRASEDMILLRSLVAQLEQSTRVRRLTTGAESMSVEEIAAEAAHSLVDIRRSAEVLSSRLPALLIQQPESAEFNDTLDDIAEELRHIHYHISNTKLFSYVVPGS